jgi:hypothetical protein
MQFCDHYSASPGCVTPCDTYIIIIIIIIIIIVLISTVSISFINIIIMNIIPGCVTPLLGQARD